MLFKLKLKKALNLTILFNNDITRYFKMFQYLLLQERKFNQQIQYFTIQNTIYLLICKYLQHVERVTRERKYKYFRIQFYPKIVLKFIFLSVKKFEFNYYESVSMLEQFVSIKIFFIFIMSRYYLTDTKNSYNVTFQPKKFENVFSMFACLARYKQKYSNRKLLVFFFQLHGKEFDIIFSIRFFRSKLLQSLQFIEIRYYVQLMISTVHLWSSSINTKLYILLS
eukprot:TRINITY_DN964_c1_g1_i11.p4 TRINITY_DN964_c1_g1~~TRINITY_DN964_c1_g1_i11.p4  ORF type:complete len:224 (-),score=-8.63 TRINITY_DN964_c1_g1_i11:209-880(-)